MLILPANLLHFHHDPAALRRFRTKTSQLLTKSDNCFDTLHVARRAFAELVVEIDYPMSKWGGAATNEYLDYTLILLDLLNSISSSLSRIKLRKFCLLHGIETPPDSAARYVRASFEMKSSPEIEMRPGSDRKERVILEALILLKKIEFFALSLVVDSLLSIDISAGECDEVVWEKMEKAILGINKEADDMFFKVMATRNELLDNIRF